MCVSVARTIAWYLRTYSHMRIRNVISSSERYERVRMRICASSLSLGRRTMCLCRQQRAIIYFIYMLVAVAKSSSAANMCIYRLFQFGALYTTIFYIYLAYASIFINYSFKYLARIRRVNGRTCHTRSQAIRLVWTSPASSCAPLLELESACGQMRSVNVPNGQIAVAF